ncbi:MAG TPA: DUF5615 family PIN-like protein [Thermoguttaceae bacterium]
MRFHLDENVDPAIAEGLRRHALEVTLPKDAGLQGAEDYKHLHFATHEKRVLVTHDSDFLRLHAQGTPHAGIVYFRRGGRSLGDFIRFLIILAECLTPEEMTNHVEFF